MTPSLGLQFTITTKTGGTVSVQADRCGGSTTNATVTEGGTEKFRYQMPDDDDLAVVDSVLARFPDIMPYFPPQDADYVTVKERVCLHSATGQKAEGVATVDVGVETLRVAEYLTPVLQEQLK